MLEESQPPAVALDQRERGAECPEGQDDNHQLQDREGPVGEGPAAARHLVVEYVAGGTGGVGPVRAHALAELRVPVPVAREAGVTRVAVGAGASALGREEELAGGALGRRDVASAGAGVVLDHRDRGAQRVRGAGHGRALGEEDGDQLDARLLGDAVVEGVGAGSATSHYLYVCGVDAVVLVLGSR